MTGAQALVSIACPLALDRLVDAAAAIAALGNPAVPDVAAALDPTGTDGGGTHFVSLHALAAPDGRHAFLLLELSADGTDEAAIARLTDAIGERLRRIFVLASDWTDGGDLVAYLRRHRLDCGAGYGQPPGLAFAGTPGLSVDRIRQEARLAARLGTLIGEQPPVGSALDRLAALRMAVAAEPDLAPMLTAALAGPPFARPGFLALIAPLVRSFLSTYLRPLVAVVLALAALAAVWSAWHASSLFAGLTRGLLAGVGALIVAGLAAFLLLLIVAGIGYVALRRAERGDAVDARPADHRVNSAMVARENALSQNHMISITERKPGLLRAGTLRLAFWVIGSLSGTLYPPGFLGSIGSIHFARWITLPGTRALVFLSNYDGSWQSYLEDFITLAHKGLTAVWSNAIGFPRTENLIGRGATDGDRFKHFARRSMIPTGFWYSAYPALTTAAIRTNATVRRGLSGAMTEDEATAFFALFGSAVRPAGKLVSSDIQSLVFGGLGFMRHGSCLIVTLPDDVAAARAWLRAVRPHVAFNDGRRLRASAVVTLAFGAPGLRKLGLPEDALSSFSHPFVEGMASDGRARLLGDTGANAPDAWTWGRTAPDAALLVYGTDDAAVARLRDELRALLPDVAGVHELPLRPVAPGKREPFGFADGISQPVIRGTYKGFRNADPIHLVEPGELVLGYPDNRGTVPPGPLLSALDDPRNLLPLAAPPPADFEVTRVELDRDLGCNGSYLVLRQLEQDVAGFDLYCQQEADRLAGEERLPEPYVVTPDFIAAKLVGRWRDGSPLARFPYEPRERARPERPTTRPTPATAGGVAPVPRSIEPDIGPENDFLFGTEDPEALRCPFGAHIRRANPRDSLAPGTADQIGITNRHRILRVGRAYREAEGAAPGILFACLNADIERQFEFLQQSWLMSPSFHGLTCEKDPLLGDAETGRCSFTIATRGGPIRLRAMPRFVTVRGGGYFFLPGRRLIDWLAAER